MVGGSGRCQVTEQGRRGRGGRWDAGRSSPAERKKKKRWKDKQQKLLSQAGLGKEKQACCRLDDSLQPRAVGRGKEGEKEERECRERGGSGRLVWGRSGVAARISN
ncbi:hypothetical protein MRB53_034569 [Persea americana]|uniref:Uncharacterized protein n=1 Tax=Persea americana TaxID=3435 RepID=A0ACC2K2N3_PERAE|nr:hypothetical protein MRB53_034569 [Persea americana]